MPITVHQNAPGIAEVVIDHPPVNALDVAGWFGLADAVLAAGRVPDNRVVIVRAEGRGFCAGVDIKEIQARGDEALIGANRGCFAAFAAVYECEVPVIAAVHGFCLGGGVGIAGNADIVVASEDATFGLPEVDRGALGAATHLSRLVPQHRMRSMVYTAEPATAAELHHYGSVLRVVPREELVRRGLRGGDHHRRQVARPSSGGPRSRSTGSTRSTSSAATGSNRDSPTSCTSPAWPTSSAPPSSRSATPTPPDEDPRDRGTRGRQTTDTRRARRRAPQRDDHRDRGVGIPPQADGRRAGHPASRPDRPHRGVLRRARRRPAVRGRQGAKGGLRLRHPGLDPHGPPLQGGPPGRGHRVHGARRGHVLPGPAGRLAAGALPPHPGRPGLRRHGGQPLPAHGGLALRRRRGAGGGAGPRGSTPPSSTSTGPMPRGRARSSDPTPSSTSCSSGPPTAAS